jgi:hypothetical protein
MQFSVPTAAVLFLPEVGGLLRQDQIEEQKASPDSGHPAKLEEKLKHEGQEKPIG